MAGCRDCPSTLNVQQSSMSSMPSMTMAMDEMAGRDEDWDWRWRTLVAVGVGGQWWRGRAGGLCGRNRGLRRRKYRAARPKSIPRRHFPHFPTISGKPARAAHPHRAGGIGKAAASRGRSDSTVRETHTIVRSGSGDFNQNHARWNRLREVPRTPAYSLRVVQEKTISLHKSGKFVIPRHQINAPRTPRTPREVLALRSLRSLREISPLRCSAWRG